MENTNFPHNLIRQQKKSVRNVLTYGKQYQLIQWILLSPRNNWGINGEADTSQHCNPNEGYILVTILQDCNRTTHHISTHWKQLLLFGEEWCWTVAGHVDSQSCWRTKLLSILLMEADYNATNKIIFGQQMLHQMRRHMLIPEEIYSWLVEDGTLAKVLFYDTIQQTSWPEGISMRDTDNCCDWIAHPIISLRKVHGFNFLCPISRRTIHLAVTIFVVDLDLEHFQIHFQMNREKNLWGTCGSAE